MHCFAAARQSRDGSAELSAGLSFSPGCFAFFKGSTESWTDFKRRAVRDSRAILPQAWLSPLEYFVDPKMVGLLRAPDSRDAWTIATHEFPSQ